MQKLKPILPSLREKKRYVAFEAISKHELSASQVSKDINEALQRLVGTLGAAKAGIMVLEDKWNARSKRGLIKVNHKYADTLKASFVLAGHETIYKSLGVSGILKKAENRFVNNEH